MSQAILSGRAARAWPSWRAALARVRGRLEAARGMREMLELDDRGLADLGLSRAQARVEGPAWELVPFLHR